MAPDATFPLTIPRVTLSSASDSTRRFVKSERTNAVRFLLSSTRLVCAWCAGLSLALALTAAAQAQTPNPASASPTDQPSLARFIPRDDLVVYVEFAGVDSRADAWKQTAAYKMLNDTNLGAMLEEMGTQLVDYGRAKAQGSKVNGAEVVTLIKHALHHGFVFAVNAKHEQPEPISVALVIRNAARKDSRAVFAKTLLSFQGKAGKAKLATKAGGRSIVVMPSDTKPESWAWWAEKDDVVIAFTKPDAADVLIDTIDGKRPNAIEQPLRAELAKEENGFLPVGLAFIDGLSEVGAKTAQAPPSLKGLQRIDYRWGFEGEGLMSISRAIVSGPRDGALALLDGPKFDQKAFLPMPAGIEGFTTFSVDFAQAFDQLVAASKGNPAASEKITKTLDELKSKSRIDLRKDLFAQIGPKVAFYAAPGKNSAAAKSSSDGSAPPNPLTMMFGGAQIPRFVLVAEVKNPAAFTKKFDELIIALNKNLRESMTPPNDKDAKDNGSPAPVPKLEAVTGKSKAYALAIPPELGKLPPGVKPTIQLGDKYLVLAINSSAATAALDIKDPWKPTGDYSKALASLPSDLFFVNVSDPTKTMPEGLASLPRTFQTTVNAVVASMSAPPGAGAPGGAPGYPGAPGSSAGAPGAPGGAPGYPGASGSSAGAPGTSSAPGTSPGGSSSGYNPGAPGSSAGFPGAPGGTGGAASAPPPLVFNIDAAKMPTADSLKAHLFPGYAALSVTNQEIRFVTREAFPDFTIGAGVTNPMFMALLMPAIQSARKAAMDAAARNAQGKGGLAPAVPGAVPPAGGASAPPAGGASAPPTGSSPSSAPTPAAPGGRSR